MDALMPLDNTLVTIIIPIYNHQNYVKECIESILTQDYPLIELIVVDDGSTDASFEVAKGLESNISDRCCNYQIIRKENGGMSSALNYGLRYASGEYIIPIASDDVMCDGRISHQIRTCSRFAIDILVSDCLQIDRNSKIVSKKKHASYSIKHILDSNKIFGYFYDLPAPALIYKKEVIDKIGGYRENIILEDKYFFLLAYHHGYSVHKDNVPVTKYRVHGSNQHRDSERLNLGRRQISEVSKQLNRPYLSNLELDSLEQLSNRRITFVEFAKMLLNPALYYKVKLAAIRKFIKNG